MARNILSALLPALLLLSACSNSKQDRVPAGAAAISVRSLLAAVPGSPEKFFVNVTGEGMTTISKTISRSQVGDETLIVPAGKGRQVKVMAFIGFDGTDFVTTGTFKYVEGASQLFNLAGGDQKVVDIKLSMGNSTSASSYPFIVKFADAANQPIANATMSYRRSSDGFILDEVATTNSSGIAYTRFLRFPFAVDVLINGDVVARGIDLTQNTLSGSHYLVNSNTSTTISGGATLQMAVGLFGKGAAALTDYSNAGFATEITARRDPFTGGAIPDLSGHLSTNSNLSALALSSGTLSPTFAAGTTSYTASVSVASITVTPTVQDSTATVTVNGTAVTSGSASGAIALSIGANTITVVVTAQDSSTKTYTVTVTRASAGNSNLSNLVLSQGVLAPTFASGTTAYTASVANDVTGTTVTPTKEDANSTITVNGTTVASGSASGSIALNVGANTITVVVTAQDSTTTTYTVTVTRDASANASLSALTLTAGELSPTFASGTTSYAAWISDVPSNFTVTPTADDAGSTIQLRLNGGAYQTVTSGQASTTLTPNSGSNTLEILVTSASGPTKTYSVSVTYGICGAGYYDNGAGSCVQVTKGFWSPANDNSRYACTNKPANSNYTSPTAGTTNCPWSCEAGYISNGTSCTSSPNSDLLTCTDTEMAVGLWGRSGAIIDKIGIRCQTYDDGSGAFTGTARNGPGYGGTGGGEFNATGTHDCPSGYYLHEVGGDLATFIGVPRTGRIRFRCKSLSDGTLSDWKPTNSTYWGGSTGRGAFSFACGSGVNQNGTYVNGIIIDKATGADYVGDALGITCR